MRKTAVAILSIVTFLAPAVSFAGINSLGGLSDTAQTFATSTTPNSPHLLIQSSATVHTFKWDGIPWRLNQGGTGATAFATGSIPFILNGIFSESNTNLFWDNVKHALGIGNSNPQHALDVSGAMYSRLVTDSDSSSLTVDWNAGNVHALTLNVSNTTLAFTNGQAGGEYKLILDQDATGGRTVTWPASAKWANRTTPTLTSAANAIDMASFVFDGTNYLSSFASDFGNPSTSTPTTAQVLVVAGGGQGGAGSGTPGAGSNSVFDNITAIGGGVGGNNLSIGGNGGSGGGGGPTNIGDKTGGTATQGNSGGGTGYGSAGGTSPNSSSPYPSSGGGGAGGVGSSTVANSNTAGAGGAGIADATVGNLLSLAGVGVGGFIAGGGGGGEWFQNGGVSGGAGGSGGGGAGSTNNVTPGSGVSNTGGGGGGWGSAFGSGDAGGGGGAGGVVYDSAHSVTAQAYTVTVGAGGTSGANGGSGGSGVVIISAPTGAITATGGTHTTSGGNDIWTFTSSDTFTITSIN